MRAAIVCMLLGGLALAGCRGSTFEEPPFHPLRNMYNQPKYIPQAKSLWFQDQRSMRTPPAGTVPREMNVRLPEGQGRLPDDSGFVADIPTSVVREVGNLGELVDRGESRYAIYCVPCHDATGSGQGMIPRYGGNPAFQPPSFHEEKFRSMADGQLFATITHGMNNMPAYGAIIPTNDRWAIVAYVRALQLSMASQKPE